MSTGTRARASRGFTRIEPVIDRTRDWADAVINDCPVIPKFIGIRREELKFFTGSSELLMKYQIV